MMPQGWFLTKWDFARWLPGGITKRSRGTRARHRAGRDRDREQEQEQEEAQGQEQG